MPEREENDAHMKYVSVHHDTIAHVPDAIVTYTIPFPDGVEGINIKTIRVESEQNIKFVIDLMDGNSNISIYESNEEIKFQYDQVDIPYKPDDKKMYVRLQNKGSLTTKFHIEIRGIEVK